MRLSLPSAAAPYAAAGLLAAIVVLSGCAGTVPPASAAPSSPATGATAAPAAPPLESVRPSLRHGEDSLVLDLLLGYRQRAQGGADPEIEHRARAAMHRLDYMLRHGGVKERGGEARSVATEDGVRLTLQDAAAQMSEALLRNAPGTAWRPETERAREIQRHRAALSTLVEDAEWVLTLDAALASALPAEDKQRLRALHEAYAAGAPHAEVTARAQAALGGIQDERLRREIKKLANRSWERERRGASAPAAPRKPTAAAASPAPASPPLPTQPAAAPSAFADSLADETPPPAEGQGDTAAAAPPERYCAERRAEAAQAFAAARGTTDPAAKARLLRQSLERLDDCIARHPDSPEAEKARQNRARVEMELGR